jgi:hypothetical protein
VAAGQNSLLIDRIPVLQGRCAQSLTSHCDCRRRGGGKLDKHMCMQFWAVRVVRAAAAGRCCLLQQRRDLMQQCRSAEPGRLRKVAGGGGRQPG